MKAIGYVRVSTAGQVADGVSLDAQEAKVHAWAGLNGAGEVVIFRDAGISGKRVKNRPGLRAALDTVGKGDALIVYSLSRLSRSIRDTLNLSEHLERRGADLVSLSEHIDTTGAGGRMVFRMLAVFAEYERELIGERVKTAWQYKRLHGEKCGGDVPFGYTVQNGRLIEDANEQKALGLIRDLRAKGYALRAICDELAKEGYRTRRGNVKWHPQALKQIIVNLEKRAA